MATVLEGTWEEIKAHEGELAGRHVRLIIEPEFGELEPGMPEPPNSIRSHAHLEEMLLQGLLSGPATPMTREDWEDIRQQGREIALKDRSSAGGNA